MSSCCPLCLQNANTLTSARITQGNTGVAMVRVAGARMVTVCCMWRWQEWLVADCWIVFYCWLHTLPLTQVPGSLEVYDRDTGVMVGCTTSLCSEGWVTLANGSQAVLNRAPYAGAWVL
jgi:hypothetical protein